jgi:hypothetical protein
MMRLGKTVLISLVMCLSPTGSTGMAGTVVYQIVDTGQEHCFDNIEQTPCPHPGQAFYGQDAQYRGSRPACRDNGDDTVSDLTTGLMWSKGLGTKKIGLDEARRTASAMRLGGHTDWRVPTIKELYSLIDFRGYTGIAAGARRKGAPRDAVPFINTDYFDFAYGDPVQDPAYEEPPGCSQ